MTGDEGAPAGAEPQRSEDFVEDVLTAVEQIPVGRVASYSDIAGLVGRGGPRQVGQVMSRHGAGVPWWRVVHADGSLIRGLEQEALRQLRAERTPLKGDRVDMSRARHTPPGQSSEGGPRRGVL